LSVNSPVKLTKKELEAQQEAILVQQRIDSKKMKMYAADTWKIFENWGRESGHLSPYLQNFAFTIAGRIRKNIKFEGFETSNGVKILEIVEEHAPELLVIEETAAKPNDKKYPTLEVNPDVLKQAVLWDKKNKKLKSISFTFLLELSNGKKPLTEQNKKIAGWNIEILQKCGFVYNAELVQE
jgi:hypothetical protein